MRFRISLVFLVITFVSFGQKFRFNSSVGTSLISWHEQQMTLDFAAEISFQNPEKNHKTFIALKTMGNLTGSAIDRSNYTFIEPPMNNFNQPIQPNEVLQAGYRGGEAEAGVIWNTHKNKKQVHLTPLLSFYSRSLARKISSLRSEYIEEEKYSLHGVSGGLGLVIPGKTSVHIQAQVFEPLYEEVTLYGRYVGVPFQSLVSDKHLNFKAKIQVVKGNFGWTLNLETLNLGGAENPKSKSIKASQAIIPSTLLTYFF
ncbi:hypothetical protein [Aquirufa antheringensis]